MFEVPLITNLLQKFRPSCIDDFADRLNYHLTTSLLCFFCVLLRTTATCLSANTVHGYFSAKQYIGSPIECWFEFEDAPYANYINSYCFVKNTYVINSSVGIPRNTNIRSLNELNYYQWVPLLLIFQAFMFYIPHQLWNFFCWQSGLNVKSLLKGMRQANLMKTDQKEREFKVKYMTQFIKDSLDMKKLSGGFCCGLSRRLPCRLLRGCSLTLCYLFVKCVYLANVVIQFRMIERFLGGDYINWGWRLLGECLSTGKLRMQSEMFPRVTYCDFRLLKLSAIHNRTVQCVLPSNILNEKAYLFLWYWMWAVGLFTAVNTLYWLGSSLSGSYQTSLIERLIRHAGLSIRALNDGSGVASTYATRGHFEKFVFDELGMDGMLVIRLLLRQVGDLNCVVVVCHLWQAFLADKLTPTLPGGGAPTQVQRCRCYGCQSTVAVVDLSALEDAPSPPVHDVFTDGADVPMLASNRRARNRHTKVAVAV